jgi:hypothetical protein
MATIRDYETVFTPEYCCKPISGSSLLDAGTAARRTGNLLPEKEQVLYYLSLPRFGLWPSSLTVVDLVCRG